MPQFSLCNILKKGRSTDLFLLLSFNSPQSNAMTYTLHMCMMPLIGYSKQHVGHYTTPGYNHGSTNDKVRVYT